MTKEDFKYDKKLKLDGENFYFHAIKIGPRRYLVNVLKKTKEKGIINELDSYDITTSDPQFAVKEAISYFKKGYNLHGHKVVV